MSATPCLNDIDPWVVERLEMWPGFRGRARCPQFVARVIAVAREVYRRQRRNRYGTFPLDRRALSSSGILPYSESQIRRVISVLASIGFVDHFGDLKRRDYRYAARHYSFGPGIRKLFGLSEPSHQPDSSETKPTQKIISNVKEEGTALKASKVLRRFYALEGDNLLRVALQRAAVHNRVDTSAEDRPEPAPLPQREGSHRTLKLPELPPMIPGESREDHLRRWREWEASRKAEKAEKERRDAEQRVRGLGFSW